MRTIGLCAFCRAMELWLGSRWTWAHRRWCGSSSLGLRWLRQYWGNDGCNSSCFCDWSKSLKSNRKGESVCRSFMEALVYRLGCDECISRQWMSNGLSCAYILLWSNLCYSVSWTDSAVSWTANWAMMMMINALALTAYQTQLCVKGNY